MIRQYIRVKKPPMHRPRAGTWPAMQEQHRLAARIAHLLPIHNMAVGERQIAGLQRSDLGKQVTAWHGIGVYNGPREKRNRGACRVTPLARTWVVLGAVAGLLAVAAAAAAAHLPIDPAAARMLASAVQMQGWHAIALVLCAVWSPHANRAVHLAGAAFKPSGSSCSAATSMCWRCAASISAWHRPAARC